MKLSELFELSPLGWEEAKRETIKHYGVEYWEWCVECDKEIESCFILSIADHSEMWLALDLYNDPTLLKEWEAKQIK